MRKWLNGRASASQAGRCGFESRLPLQKKNARTRAFFFCALYGKKNRCLCKQTNRSLSRAIEDCERHGAIAKLSRLPLQTAYKGALCALFAWRSLFRNRNRHRKKRIGAFSLTILLIKRIMYTVCNSAVSISVENFRSATLIFKGGCIVNG